MTAVPSSATGTLLQDTASTASDRIVWFAPDGAAAATLRGLGLEAGTGDPGKLDTYRGAVAVVVPEDESAAAVMKAAVMARRLRDVAAKVCRAPITVEDFRHAAKAGVDPKDWQAVAEAADLPPWTPEAAEAATLDAEARSAEDEALDLALASGREPSPAADEPDPWEEPIPLDGAAVLPPFPLDALPGYVADFVREVAASFEVHADMPATFALGVGAAACQKKYRVHIQGDHYEPTNLFLAAVADSAGRKSAVLPKVLSPLLAFEDEKKEREHVAFAQAEVRHQVEQERRKKLQETAAKGRSATERSSALRELEDIAADPTEPPALFRLTVGADALPEVLATLLNRHGGKLTMHDPEGGTLFKNFGGQYSGGNPNFEILLKAHAGDSVQVFRQSKPALDVRNPCLTLILAIQPDVVSRLADVPQFKERGLAGRFLFSFQRSMAGHRTFSPPRINEATWAVYADRVRSALELEVSTDADGREVAHVLKFAGDAAGIQREMSCAIDGQVLDGGELHGMTDWGGKAHGAAARVAGVLHVLDHAGHGGLISKISLGVNADRRENKYSSSLLSSSCSCGGRPELVPISAQTTAAAWRILTYFKAHALHAYALMGADSGTALTVRVLAWIKEHGGTKFKKSELRRARFQNLEPKELDAPLRRLEDHEYIRRLPDTPSAPRGGRPPSPTFLVNPLWVKTD